MPAGEGHYSQQQPQQQGQQWTPQQQQSSHLLPPAHPQSSFPSPSSPASTLSEQHYPSYYQQQQQQQQQQAQPNGQNGQSQQGQQQQQQQQQGAQSAISEPMDKLADRSHTGLSLNLSSLSVTSPTNLSPINPSPHPSTHASSHVSPITPISPAGLHNPALSAHHHSQQTGAGHHGAHMHQQQPFQFAAPDHGVRYDESHYNDYTGTRRLTSSRSSSSSEKSVPRKRSFTTVTPLATSVEESYDQSSNAMDTSPYDEVDMAYSGLDAEGSPIDGSTSGGEQDDQLKPLEGQIPSGNSTHPGMPPSLSILGKPLGTNNFVTKLYQSVPHLCFLR